MADVTISVQKLTKSGLAATYTTDSVLNGSDTFVFENGDATFLHVKNGDAAQHTVTVQTPAEIAGLAIAELSVDVPASGEKFIGPFPPGVFNNNSGNAKFTLDAGTSMQVAILRM